MKKLLAITGPFVPHNETVTLLSYKHLRELDVDVTVVALEGKEDETIKKELEDDVKFSKFNIKYSNCDWHKLSINKQNLNIFKIIYNLYKYYKMTINESKKERYDYIYSSSIPNYTHAIANKIKKKYKNNIMWIASFSDPIKDNLYTELENSKAKTIKGKIVNFVNNKIHNNPKYQEQTLKNADCLIFVSEEQRDYMVGDNEEYKQKSMIIPFTYIKDWEIYKELLKPNMFKNKKEELKLVHFGNIYGLRKIDNFLEAIKKIQSENPDLLKNVVIEQYGFIEKSYIDKIEKLNLKNIFKIYDKITYKECIKKMKEDTDCLIIFDTILEEDKGQPWLPSKILEYLISKKPIFSVCNKKSPIYRLLNKEHICTTYDIQDIKNKLQYQLENVKDKEFDEMILENEFVQQKALQKIVNRKEK